MAEIRAVVVDPTVASRLVLRSVAAPLPAAHEAVVTVAAISLNRGEIRRAGVAEAGWRPGWDLAGTVTTAAADGTGPTVGTRVVGFLPAGAWAEQVAVPTHALAALPDTVSFAEAATLPVAGLTAYHVLRQGGFLLDRQVLITGASGGVGHTLIQLAALSGARVVAHLRTPQHQNFVAEAGANAIAIGADLTSATAHGPYDLIADSIGGTILAEALALVAPRGIVVSFGTTAGRDVTFNAGRFYGSGPATLYGFILFQELHTETASAGLARLVRLVAAGRLKPAIQLEASWHDLVAVAQQLTDRSFPGKAVLHLDR